MTHRQMWLKLNPFIGPFETTAKICTDTISTMFSFTTAASEKYTVKCRTKIYQTPIIWGSALMLIIILKIEFKNKFNFQRKTNFPPNWLVKTLYILLEKMFYLQKYRKQRRGNCSYRIYNIYSMPENGRKRLPMILTIDNKMQKKSRLRKLKKGRSSLIMPTA